MVAVNVSTDAKYALHSYFMSSMNMIIVHIFAEEISHTKLILVYHIVIIILRI